MATVQISIPSYDAQRGYSKPVEFHTPFSFSLYPLVVSPSLLISCCPSFHFEFTRVTSLRDSRRLTRLARAPRSSHAHRLTGD